MPPPLFYLSFLSPLCFSHSSTWESERSENQPPPPPQKSPQYKPQRCLRAARQHSAISRHNMPVPCCATRAHYLCNNVYDAMLRAAFYCRCLPANLTPAGTCLPKIAGCRQHHQHRRRRWRFCALQPAARRRPHALTHPPAHLPRLGGIRTITTVTGNVPPLALTISVPDHLCTKPVATTPALLPVPVNMLPPAAFVCAAVWTCWLQVPLHLLLCLARTCPAVWRQACL